jgi:hypothetical protein
MGYFMWEPEDTPAKRSAKLMTLLICVFLLGGSLIWVVGGYILSLLFLKLLFLCIKIIK